LQSFPEDWIISLGRDLHALNKLFLQNELPGVIQYWDPLVCLIPYPEITDEMANNFFVESAAALVQDRQTSLPLVIGATSSLPMPATKQIKLQFKKWEKRANEIQAKPSPHPFPTSFAPSFVSSGQHHPDFADRVRKICLLCFRQFKSIEELALHIEKSSLHSVNLAEYTRLTSCADDLAQLEYKNRAAERRMVHHDDQEGAKSTKKAKISTSVEMPIAADNKGAQLLKRMGWREGEGLGAESEGIVEPVKASGRKGRSGIGTNIQ